MVENFFSAVCEVYHPERSLWDLTSGKKLVYPHAWVTMGLPNPLGCSWDTHFLSLCTYTVQPSASLWAPSRVPATGTLSCGAIFSRS